MPYTVGDPPSLVNPLPIQIVGGGGSATSADGSDATQGSVADAAWPGAGTGTVISLLKAIWAKLGSPNYAYTDRSGAITTASQAQVLMPANASRKGGWIQNLSTTDLWISSVGAAVGSQPSLKIGAGAYYEFPANGVPNTAISIFGAVAGLAFSAREW